MSRGETRNQKSKIQNSKPKTRTLKPSPSSLNSKPKERDYSHRSLIDKLGVKEYSRISILGVKDDAFFRELKERASMISVGRIQTESDLIFYEANSRTELGKLKGLKRNIKRDGAIWVVSLKGRLARIRDVEVITAAKAVGLVDNKVVGFSPTHTSLRLVIPVKER